MTDYGRSPGSEPWQSDDPLNGDQGWEGQQAVSGHASYGGQPQQPYPQQQPQGYGVQDPYQQQYDQQYDQQFYDGGQQYAADPQAYGAHQQHYGGAGQYDGGWDPGPQTGTPYGGAPGDPYGGAPAETYGGAPAETYTGGPAGYGSRQEADYYSTPEAYPPPRPPGRRADPEPEATPWESEAPEEEKHPFFTDDGLGDDGATRDDDPRGDRDAPRRGGGSGAGERRGKGKKKSRNGCACLVVSLVLVGGLGGGVYFGYQFWQDRFGPPADYSGAGTGSVTIEVPKGAGLLEIGNILEKQGVVKSAGAFVSAANENPERARSIQDGVYLLAQEMSGANAVKAMLDPKSRNALVIPEGKRNSFVYAEIDKRLGLKKGTTQGVAKTEADSLGLPEWAEADPDAKDPLEGFLFPASYPVAKGMKPEAVLKKMVARANQEFGKKDLNAEAQRLGLKSPLQVLTIASLVQAEGKYKQDFDKVSRVVYNRLKPGNAETVGRLEFDSTVNYFRNQSTLDIGSVNELRKLKDPYNTYRIQGLPPGPIGNPGMAAFNSALDPTPGPWYYFVSINEDETIFAETNEEHERNRRKYQEQRENSGQ
ncbi:endolytic transglycosylase MltG [Streptomyces sp. NPDC004838]